MAREYVPKLTIAVLVFSVAIILLSAQSSAVAASSSPSGSYSPSYHHHSGYYSSYSTYGCSSSYWNYYYWNSWYCSDYYYYPYYSYYYGYPYYYSNYYSSYNTPSSYTLTVATDPSSLGTVTGGGSYTQGTSATFSVTQSTVQVSPTQRYVFSGWSGGYSGVGTSGSVTVNNAMTVTAEYQLQYLLTVNVQPQSAPLPAGAGWFNAGNTATLQNAGQTVGGDGGSRLVFQGWSVDGQAPQAGSTMNLMMNAAHTVTALYGQQYYLNVQSDQGVTSGSGWYDAGTTAQIYVTTPVSTQYGVSIIFNGWQGDIQSSSQSTTVAMNGPMNVVATWRTDPTVLYLTIGAIIVAAVLIVAGLIAFVVRGRGGTQPPATQALPPAAQPPASTGNSQNDQTVTSHRSERHRKKATTETETSEPPASTS